MRAQRHDRNDADVIQCEIQGDKLDAIGELNDDAILRLQSQIRETARHALRRANEFFVRNSRVAVDDGSFVWLTARGPLDHLGNGHAFPKARVNVPSRELGRPGHESLQHVCRPERCSFSYAAAMAGSRF